MHTMQFDTNNTDSLNTFLGIIPDVPAQPSTIRDGAVVRKSMTLVVGVPWDTFEAPPPDAATNPLEAYQKPMSIYQPAFMFRCVKGLMSLAALRCTMHSYATVLVALLNVWSVLLRPGTAQCRLVCLTQV